MKAKKSNEATDYFLLSLFSNEIRHSVAEHYKTDNVSFGSSDSIFIKYGHDSKDIPVVEMVQSGKGHELPNSYLVKINVTPQKKGILGRDTITFGVEPNKNEKGNIEIRMLDYKHTAPSEK
ncbi:DUF3888 domain-containing protein [Niallia sp. 03190]|uniref:DUF3888 domain-containing protein n=1 Tax=Niallia sp. 03190 TaxID=3458061 RepID=UPI004043D076